MCIWSKRRCRLSKIIRHPYSMIQYATLCEALWTNVFMLSESVVIVTRRSRSAKLLYLWEHVGYNTSLTFTPHHSHPTEFSLQSLQLHLVAVDAWSELLSLSCFSIANFQLHSLQLGGWIKMEALVTGTINNPVSWFMDFYDLVKCYGGPSWDVHNQFSNNLNK